MVRLLTVVEKQSETIDEQGKRIKELEDQIAKYSVALDALDKKVDDLALVRGEKHGLEDDEGTYVEV